MVDFVGLIREDFRCGKIVFVGSAEDAEDITRTLFANEPIQPRFVLQQHPLAYSYFISSADAHEAWDGQAASRTELSTYIILPWSTITQTINSLNNDDVDTIIDRFVRSEAYINILPMGEDIDEILDMIGRAADDKEIYPGEDMSCCRDYIEDLSGDLYMNLYVDTSERPVSLNASNAYGVGIDGSSIKPSVVYPAVYLAKKVADVGNTTPYTDEDFDGIFN